MTEPATDALSCLAWDGFGRLFQGDRGNGFHRIAYRDWGAREGAPVLLAVHGLTRNAHDFDTIARALSNERRVVCPDLPGRGESEWLADPHLYAYVQYVADMAALVGRLGGRIDWLGTSLGGLVGMMMAAMSGTPIRRLIMNDVGAFIPKAALERIADYVSRNPRFASVEEAESYLRALYVTFGRLSDATWRDLATHGIRALPEGGYALAYDPAIAEAFRAVPLIDVDLWAIWEKVECPVLIIRGETSDVLPAEIAAGMVKRKANATLVEFANCGHAPALVDEAQITAVRDWLERTPAA